MATDAENWNAIFYGPGKQNVQLTNELYRQKYGAQGTTVGYQNTPSNPASTANPLAFPGGQGAVYTNPQGTAQRPAGAAGGPPTGPTAGPPPSAPGSPQYPSAPGAQQPPGSTTGGGVPGFPSTQELLDRFLESDPDLMLNLVANRFRDMGASEVFMTWFTRSFSQLWGEFLGRLAQMAVNGQVPDVSFKDWVMQADVTNSFYQSGGPSTGQSGTWGNFVAGQGAA